MPGAILGVATKGISTLAKCTYVGEGEKEVEDRIFPGFVENHGNQPIGRNPTRSNPLHGDSVLGYTFLFCLQSSCTLPEVWRRESAGDATDASTGTQAEGSTHHKSSRNI